MNTTIEWTTGTWNPCTGCSPVGPDCANCYAAQDAAGRLSTTPRYSGLAIINQHGQGVFNGTIKLHYDKLEDPLRWPRPSRIFVNSMSDLFHENIPLEFIERAFWVMNKAHWHQFQILTKRPERVRELDSQLKWGPNIWMGTSVGVAKGVSRIDALRKCSAQTKFLSIEPLIESLGKLDLSEIDWVILGGESGPHARPMSPDWAREVRDQCVEQGTSLFFKQWGRYGPDGKKRAGKHFEGYNVLDGQIWEQYP